MSRRCPVLSVATAMAFLMTAACEPGENAGLLTASVIGTLSARPDPIRAAITPADALLVQATAQGLVRFDAAGQIEPGVAVRWAVSEDGLFYTFRLQDEAGISAEAVSLRLRAALARMSRNSLRPIMGAIDSIDAVTPEVIEIGLRGPRPGLLELLAQPEMGLLRKGPGTGPLRIVTRQPHVLLLQPREDAADDSPAAGERTDIRLHVERAGLAVARFSSRQARVVLGGRFQDLAVARAAKLRAGVLRFDPAAGLFGLRFSSREGFVAFPDNRRALAMALDRDAIVAAFGVRDWRATATMLPAELKDHPPPATPDWIDTPLRERRTIAAATVADWSARETAIPTVTIALPAGPGARLLYALLRQQWAAIGVDLRVAGPADRADLMLIDEVAPTDTASWYLRHFDCASSPVCSDIADRLMDLGRDAPTLVDRAVHLADADARLVDLTPFIAIATPLRWSLAEPRFGGWQENVRSVHPLYHLRDPRS